MDVIDQVLAKRKTKGRYESRLSIYPHDKSLIDNSVKQVQENLLAGKNKFVIYGEPQCGKTELMIHLSCKLFDMGTNLIVVLMHDIKALQMQNFNERFAVEKHFGAKPMTEEDFADLDDKDRHSKNDEKWLVVGRKNSKRLAALVENSRKIKNRVIIDDECDFATPDYNVQRKVKKLGDNPSPVNKLVTDLVGEGSWIGVTATPAKIDLNNTLDSNTQDTVIHKSGEAYTGADYFFPSDQKKITEEKRYLLNVINDEETNKDEELKNAVYGFLVRTAYLNITKKDFDPSKPDKYSMIVHSAVNMAIHESDKKVVEEIENNLRSEDLTRARIVLEAIQEKISRDTKIDKSLSQEILTFIDENRNGIKLYLFNSKKSIDQNMESLKPKSVFTIIFGGHCLSRGVTFNNLLSLFFLRGAVTFNQGTYIQLARHFGYRKEYAQFFELTVPKDNWRKWYLCFTNHRKMEVMLANGTPVHLVDSKVRPVDFRSIDTNTVIMPKDNKSMAFGMFDYTKEVEELFCREDITPLEILQKFRSLHKENETVFPQIFYDEILEETKKSDFGGIDIILATKNHNKIGFNDITKQKSLTDEEKESIARKRGGLGPSTGEKNLKDAFCWIRPYKNPNTGKVRIIYVRNIRVDYYENTLNRNELVSSNSIKALESI